MTTRRPPKELADFLAAFDPKVAKLHLATRRVVLSAAPDADELIYDAYNAVTAAYSFSGRLKEAFCHVAAYRAHVNLGFNRGVELPDPSQLLRGSGAKIRHARIGQPSDLRSDALLKLVAAAVQQGRALAPEAVGGSSSTVRPTTGGKRRPGGSRRGR